MNISKSIRFQKSHKGTKKTAQIQIFFAKNSKSIHAYIKSGKNPVIIDIPSINKHT